MLMTKSLDSKILYSLLIVSGFVLTIGAASAVVMYSENIELDNGAGDSSIKVTSSTGASKIIIEDQGGRAWSITTDDGKKRLQITDETLSKPRLSIKKNGNVGINTINPQEKLDVKGNFRTRMNADIAGNLNVDGVITGSYIANLEATIAALEARIAALEGSTVPMVLANEAMITTHDIMITDNSASIAVNAASIDDLEAGIPPQTNDCDPDGDGVITAQEMWDYKILIGYPGFSSIEIIQINIDAAENAVASPLTNGVLDNALEITYWNGQYFVPNGFPSCPT